MSKYRISAYPTFLTQYNVYKLQTKRWLFWRTIADFRSIDDALATKVKLEQHHE